ncbi:MAG: hypothetical protein AAFR83_22640 [Cyanobacteria bacterium J06629_18]
MVKVILRFGNGNVENGCEHISVEVRSSDDKLIAQDSGNLPANPELWELYECWKSSFISNYTGSYTNNYPTRIKIIEDERRPSNIQTINQIELLNKINEFPTQFNQWLDCDGFRAIENLLRNHLKGLSKRKNTCCCCFYLG